MDFIERGGFIWIRLKIFIVAKCWGSLSLVITCLLSWDGEQWHRTSYDLCAEHMAWNRPLIDYKLIHVFVHSKKHLLNSVAHILVLQYLRMIILVFLGKLEKNVGPKRFRWFSSCWLFARFAFFLNAKLIFSASSERGPGLPMQPAKFISFWKCLKCWVMLANVTGQSVPSLQLSECPLPARHDPPVFIALFLHSKWASN